MPGSRPKRIHKPNVRLPGVREEREEQEKTERGDVAKKERKKQVEQGKKKRAGETKMREKQEMTAREKKRKSEVDEPTVSSLKSPTNTDLEEERGNQVEQGKKKRAQDGCTVVSVTVVQDNSTIGHKGQKEITSLFPAVAEEEEVTPSVPSPLSNLAFTSALAPQAQVDKEDYSNEDHTVQVETTCHDQ